jgi:hypothetical protein
MGLCVAAVSTGVRLGTGKMQLEAIVFSSFAAVALGIVGGWFGHNLFPPISRMIRGKGMGPASA